MIFKDADVDVGVEIKMEVTELPSGMYFHIYTEVNAKFIIKYSVCRVN